MVEVVIRTFFIFFYKTPKAKDFFVSLLQYCSGNKTGQVIFIVCLREPEAKKIPFVTLSQIILLVIE